VKSRAEIREKEQSLVVDAFRPLWQQLPKQCDQMNNYLCSLFVICVSTRLNSSFQAPTQRVVHSYCYLNVCFGTLGNHVPPKCRIAHCRQKVLRERDLPVESKAIVTFWSDYLPISRPTFQTHFSLPSC
jgi:hypothetical protein